MNRRINLWPVAFVVAVLSTISVMQHRDDLDNDIDVLAMREHRDWMQAVAHCHRAFGPQTAPEYDDSNHLVCVGKRGQRHIQVAIKPDDLKVAGK